LNTKGPPFLTQDRFRSHVDDLRVGQHDEVPGAGLDPA
jgi:hypothetical protein